MHEVFMNGELRVCLRMHACLCVCVYVPECMCARVHQG